MKYFFISLWETQVGITCLLAAIIEKDKVNIDNIKRTVITIQLKTSIIISHKHIAVKLVESINIWVFHVS